MLGLAIGFLRRYDLETREINNQTKTADGAAAAKVHFVRVAVIGIKRSE